MKAINRTAILAAVAAAAFPGAVAAPAAAAPGHSKYVVSATARFHGAFVSILAGNLLYATSQRDEPNLSIFVTAKRGKFGTETDSFTFHLNGNWLAVSPRGARIDTGKQLGQFGRIQLDFGRAAIHRSFLCPKQLKRLGKVPFGRGKVILHLGNGPFADMNLSRLSANIYPATRKVPPCEFKNHPVPPTNKPPERSLILGGNTPLGSTEVTAGIENHVGLLIVTASEQEDRASVLHALFFSRLPQSILETANGKGTVKVGGELAPYASGSIEASPELSSMPTACPQSVVGSGKLTFQFELTGELVFSSGQGLLCSG